MNQFILEDVHQIRSIAQQVAQAERQNAQQFSQQPGLQAIAQQETFSAQQLQHVVDLTNRIEQALVQNQYSYQQPAQQFYGQALVQSQMQPQMQSHVQPQHQSYAPTQWSQSQVDQNALNAVMRAAQPAQGNF